MDFASSSSGLEKSSSSEEINVGESFVIDD
jgi:hypothetical protein